MNRMFGDPSGAFLRINGAQSAFESRTSSLITPLKAGVESVADSAAVAVANLVFYC